MLVTTLSAFALDFTDYRKVTLGSNTPTESNDAKLSVTDNGDGTYNVTFNDIINKDGSYTDNYGTFTFSNVSGSKSGDVTTVTATDVTGTVSGGGYGITEFTKGNLSLKFKDGKAYATMAATCTVWGRDYIFDVVFGTDEGFGGGSTGGGETGGEDKPAAFEKLNFVGDGTQFKWNIPVDWDTQKIVMSISTATCTTGCEHIIGLGVNGTSWGNNLHMYRTSDGQELQCYFDAGAGNNNTGKFPEGNPIKVEISKANGFIVDGTTRIAASKLANLFAMSEVVMSTGEGANILSHATYNYVKVVPLDWTEVPPVTVAETFTYDQDAFVGPNDTKGTANVKVYKMTDDSYTMEITAPVATKVGVITVGEDAKGRTTYMGEVESSVVSGVKYVVSGVVYEEGGAKHLYMTLTHDDDTYIIGENPDAPKVVSTLPFENVAYTTSMGGNGTATVTFTEMSDGTFPMTFVSDDLNVKAENLTKGTDEKGRTTYTGTAKRTDVDVTFTVKAVVYGETTAQKLYMTMDNGSSLVVTVGEDPDYVAPVTYKNTLKVVRGTDTKAYENAEVSVLAKGENKYAVTIPSFTDMDQMEGTIGKLTFEATGVEENGTLKLTATSATTTQEGGTGWETATFTASMDATVTGETLAGTFTVVYPQDVTNYTYTLYYGVAAPDVITEKSNKTYTSNLRILDGEETVVEEAEANVNIIKYSDDSYKVTLKNVSLLNKTQDLVFEGTALVEETTAEADAPLTIKAKSDEATTTFFGEQMNGTFEITEVSAEEIKMGFVLNNTSLEYHGEFNYTEEETPEVYTSNLHIYDAAAPETDLFQADQAKVEFLATATGEFKLTLKDVTLNEKKSDLVFTGTLPTTEPGGQDPLAEEGEGEVTPAEPAMVLNATADDATTRFFDVATYPTAVFNVSYDKNDNFMMTFTIAAGAKNYGGEFNYEKKNPDTPDPELFCKEDYVADGTGFEWDINVDWDTQKIVMSIDPSTCTGSCEDVIGLGAVPTAWNNTLHLYRTSEDQMLQGYFQNESTNNNTGKFAETAPFLVEVSKAQGFVVNNEVKIASSAMSYLFTLPTVKMGTGEGANDKSRATYNYVKVVDKDWTAPKDPDTGINATTVAEGEVEFFTVNGVKLNKLQKGLNIVRSADGKVKKVLVK